MKTTLSLPARLSLAVLSVLVVVTVTADALAVRELRAHLAESVSASLSGMIGRMARQMDRDLAALKELLAAEAALLEGLSPEEVCAALARDARALDLAFDDGVLLVDATGAVTADTRNRSARRDVNLAERDFFQRVFATGQPAFSDPFAAGDDDSTPLVTLAVPVRNRSGRTEAVLVGGISLESNRVFEQPTGIRTSRYGQIGVFTLSGRVIAHSEKDLILRDFENPLPEGPESSDASRTIRTVSADGEPTLLAASRLREADWLLAGVFPSREVYRPIDRGFAAAHWWFAAGLASSCALVLLISRQTVKDLAVLTAEVVGIGSHGPASAGQRVGAAYRGEAGTLAAAINAMLGSLEAARAEAEDLSSRLADAEEKERRIIAANLHDSVCQNLALANLRLGVVKKHGGGEAGAAVDEVRGLLEQSVDELKTLTFNLSPGILYELGLLSALEWYAEGFEKKYGVPVGVRCVAPLGTIDDEQAIFLYRAVGELTTNAAKHAVGATRIDVMLGRNGGDIVVEVTDDGCGMPEQPSGGKGFGLSSLRVRARQFGGSLAVAPREEGGTLVCLRVPAP